MQIISIEEICVKCQTLFSRQTIIKMVSAEFAQRVVKVNQTFKSVKV